MRDWLFYKILREVKRCYLTVTKQIYHSISIVIPTIIYEHYHDKKLGIMTSATYSFKDRISFYKDEAQCQPTPYNVLEKIAGHLKLNDNDVFIDLGCGAGRVIFFFGMQNLKKVIGVELRKEIFDIAKRNLNNLKLNKTSVEIFNADCVNFNLDKGTLFFMFHPFGPKTLTNVIENIRNNLITNPRRIQIIYYNAAFQELLNNQDWLKQDGEIAGTKTFVWHNLREDGGGADNSKYQSIAYSG